MWMSLTDSTWVLIKLTSRPAFGGIVPILLHLSCCPTNIHGDAKMSRFKNYSHWIRISNVSLIFVVDCTFPLHCILVRRTYCWTFACDWLIFRDQSYIYIYNRISAWIVDWEFSFFVELFQCSLIWVSKKYAKAKVFFKQCVTNEISIFKENYFW